MGDISLNALAGYSYQRFDNAGKYLEDNFSIFLATFSPCTSSQNKVLLSLDLISYCSHFILWLFCVMVAFAAKRW